MRYITQRPTGGWRPVWTFLAIALGTVLVLALLLKKTNPQHLTIGAIMVMLLYLAVGGFLVLASRIFVTPRDQERR